MTSLAETPFAALKFKGTLRPYRWREPPTIDDWLVLISDYALGCLRAHPGEAAEERFTELQVALRAAGPFAAGARPAGAQS